MAEMSGWRIALNILGAMLLVVFGSCALCVYVADHKKSEDAARKAGAAKKVAPPPIPVPSSISRSVSYANFTKDTHLDECTDFTVTILSDLDDVDEAGAKFLDAIAVSLRSKEMKKRNPNLSIIGKTCAEQFQSARVLAACTVHNDGMDAGTAGRSVDIVSRYYNLDTITRSDAYMKSCFDDHGDWQAVDKNSDEYREAVRTRARREMEGVVEKAEKMQKALGQ
jgi:hypothetical protein